MSLYKLGVATDPGSAIRGAQLRPDQLRLLADLATGASLVQVARAHGASLRTVQRRIRAVCRQLGVETTVEAVAWACRHQLI